MQNITYKFRIKPTKEQSTRLNQWIGMTRFVYNQQLDLDNRFGKFSYIDAAWLLTHFHKDRYPWLKDANTQSLQSALRQLEQSWQKFFKNPGPVGPPKFKKKDHNESIIFPQDVKLNISGKSIKVPKIGNIKIIRHRKLPPFKTVAFKKDGDQWYATFTCQFELKPMVKEINKIVGVDINSQDLAITSDGKKYKNPKFYKESKEKLARAQRILARKQKGSMNRKKAKTKLQKIYRKNRNQRRDFLWKIASNIVNEYDLVVLEDLNVKGMQQWNGHMIQDAWLCDV
jgi:putative transposase